MARQFSPRNFLRKAPLTLLKDFLAQFEIGRDINWPNLSPSNIEPLFQAINQSDARINKEINLAFKDIHAMASEQGILTILKEAREHGIDINDTLKEKGDCYEKAFWVYVNHPEVFRSAQVMDIIEHRRSVKRGGFPALIYELDGESKDRLGRALSEYYLRRDARGQGYTVDCYEREGRHLFYAYLEGYVASKLIYDDERKLTNEKSRPAFQLIFRYDPSELTLEIHGASGKRILKELQMIFCEAVLKCSIEPPPDQITYDLKPLLESNFELVIAPESSVRSARVKSLEISLWGKKGIKINIDAQKDYGLLDIQDIIDGVLTAKRVPRANLTVNKAHFKLDFHRREGKSRGESLPFSVTYPDSCSLKDGMEKDDEARKILKNSGIDISGPDSNFDGEPPRGGQPILDY